MHRLYYDVKLAAARSGYYLNSYVDDVDHDGFDVIFDDQDYIKKIQVKSVASNSSTGSWFIHKKILRPSLYLADRLGFESSPTGVGTEGGVILIEFEAVNGNLEIDYYYTDVFILMAFYCEVIKHKHGQSKKAVHKCLSALWEGLGSDQIKVPRAAFIKSKNVDSLLSLIGLSGKIGHSWQHHIVLVANELYGGDTSLQLPENVTLEAMKEIASDVILSLTSQRSLYK